MRTVQIDDEVDRVLRSLATTRQASANDVLRALVGLPAEHGSALPPASTGKPDIDVAASRLPGRMVAARRTEPAGGCPTACDVSYVSEWGP